MNKHKRQARLKEIQNKLLPDMEAERLSAQSALTLIQRTISKLEAECVDLAASLIEKTPTTPRVSDHALIRFLERHHKFDLDKFRDEILDDDTKAAIKAGATTINRCGVKFRVQGNVITTTLK